MNPVLVNGPSNLTARDEQKLQMLEEQLGLMRLLVKGMLDRLDCLELDQEVLWDDMERRQKAAEMFPEELIQCAP